MRIHQSQIENVLTEQELALAADASVLLAKNKIIQTVYELFGRLADAYKLPAAILPTAIIYLHPKISKGENYLGLPWVMLDYPRNFTGKNTFAIRTMFWWGHYFSLHLLLQGDKMQLLDMDNLNTIAGWYFSTATDPWNHSYDELTAIPAHEATSVIIQSQAEQGFYKISTYLPLQQWDAAEAFLTKKIEEVLHLIRVNQAYKSGK